jgi:hypothetical protein
LLFPRYSEFPLRRQNRIEKYAPDGRLLWRADRPLNYGTDVIEKGTIKRGKGIIVIRLSKM